MRSNFKNLYTSNNPPLQATLIRGSNIESIHKIHAVISDKKGRVLMCAGNPEYKSFIRSALKPFQAIPFVSSGAASKINNNSKSIALACGSHSGSKLHSREAFKILWEYDIDINNLKCPKIKTSPLEHNCSGKHAAFLATCKKMNWPLESYLNENRFVLVDVTADWCVTCQFNKITTLNTKKLVDFLIQHEVLVIRADWTNKDKDIFDFIKRYNRYGIPVNIVYGPKNKEGILLPEILSKDIVIDKLMEAGIK